MLILITDACKVTPLCTFKVILENERRVLYKAAESSKCCLDIFNSNLIFETIFLSPLSQFVFI